MDRRSLLRGGAATAGAGVVSMLGAPGSAAAAPAQRPPAEPRMVLGTQRRGATPAMLREFKRHGVARVCGYPVDPPHDQGTGDRGYWLVSEVEREKERIESHGMEMDMVALPFLGSTLIDTEHRPAIMLGKSPERDRDIEDVQKMIAACAKAGVRTIKYNMSILGVISTGEVPGRGGAILRRFRARDLDHTLPDTIAGKVDADTFWERIDYFLERVVPVANEYRVRLACHPQDPGTPPGGYRGVEENVLSVPGGKGLFKFLDLRTSPYHGLNLCCGTLSEMLWEPQREVYPIVRELVATKRVFNIHLRNIKGRRDDFVETWPDDGDIDHTRIINILADEGYDGAVDPDHVPESDADPAQSQAFAQGYGYILGAIAAARHRS
ncbi:mannonate dehydratase [Amycolatopsis sp. YIM 10]|uniref:mannonate dehydratase n=1 Tax=Amycolatopsis sp. YIM 10 TaxID=2653857 RepID=UPI001290208B|nr:mannonate dehydratase [Amycolatopsis sp. YIM 10]QFU89819.1 Mannonate dehydratase [Amycolatopsis sp. YIM 10]